MAVGSDGKGVIRRPQESLAHDGQPCRTCGVENVKLHFDSVTPPERVNDLVVRDRGRCTDCVVNGK